MSENTTRRSLRNILRVLFRSLTRLEVRGRENLPVQGGYLVATNHLSIIDPALVYALLDRYDVTALVAKKHLKNPFFRWLVNAIGGIWLNRDEADSRALRAARAHLKAGGVLGIAPEGTRSKTKKLIQAKTGAAYLVDKTDVPIIPVGIIGTEDAFHKLARFQRPKIVITFGEPFTLPPIDRVTRDADMQRNTDEIMARIASLLPEKYWGVYSANPRLAELVATEGQRGKN